MPKIEKEKIQIPTDPVSKFHVTLYTHIILAPKHVNENEKRSNQGRK